MLSVHALLSGLKENPHAPDQRGRWIRFPCSLHFVDFPPPVILLVAM